MKKKLLIAAAILGLSFVQPMMVSAKEAQKLDLKYELSTGESSKYLCDNNVDTVVKLEKGSSLTIEAEEAIQGIYIQWNYIPKDGASLSSGKDTIKIAQNGYVHEYVPINLKASKCTITFEENASIAEVSVYAKGDLPSSVQVWNTMEEEADLLVLPAFSFHEALFFGGPIANYAAEGYKVQVMYMCGYDDAGSITRIHEMLNCLWKMGVDWYPVSAHQNELYSKDMAQVKQQYDAKEITQLVKEGIEKYEPLVVVGQDLAGEDGNCVHMLWADCLKNALSELEEEESYVPQKVYFHNYKENQIILDISETNDLLDKAYKSHQTQAFRKVWPSDEIEDPLNCVLYGLYNTKVGFDTSNDMMEHIREREKKEESEPESELGQEPEESVGQISIIDDVKESKLNMLGIIGLILIGIGVVILIAAGLYTAAWRAQNKRKNRMK